MVGFMRRYDDAYRAMKAALTAGDDRRAAGLLLRAPQPVGPPSVTTEGVLVDTCVHDIDVSRYLFDTEVTAAQVFSPRRSRQAAEGLQDPVLVHLELANGVIVNVEAAVNVAYGYDIRGEVLGETGTIELAESSPIVVKREGQYSGSGAGGLAGALHARLRHRVPGVDRRGGRRALDRPQLVGRLRRHGGHRRLRRGLPHGSATTVSMREKPDLYAAGPRPARPD